VTFAYRCPQCGTSYQISAELMLCPSCSRQQRPHRPLAGILETVLQPDGRDTQRYREMSPAALDPLELLPVGRQHFPAIPVGNTPLWQPERLRALYKKPHLYLKDDTANPTGSFKDRASFLVAAFARKYGLERVVVASTGNAASSMAGVGAAAGLEVVIFVPRNAPRAKLVQSLQCGAQVVAVDGSYDQASALSFDFVKSHGGLCRNTGYNPLTIEGKKTAALEIYRDLGGVPDYVFVPVGDGVILSGIYKGFEDLVTLGMAERVPTLIACQARGSDAISRAFTEGEFTDPRTPGTIADSISVGVPAAGVYAVRCLSRNNGRCVTVSDAEITAAQHSLAAGSGLFAEPAAAAAMAGFTSVADTLPRESRIVLLITGSGLKDIDAAAKGVEMPV